MIPLYACLIAALALGALIAGWSHRRDTPPSLWPSVVGLGGVIAGLLAVGVVSGTVIRHVIQVAPAALALILVASGFRYGRAAALPILTVWAVVMGAIWLFLLGVASIVRGRFTPTEIVLTIVIAAACLAGLTGGARPTANLSRIRRTAAATVSAICQLAALWASMQPWANGR